MNLRLLKLLRFTPFPTDTEEGRGRERERRIALTAAAAGVARIISMTAPLVTIPLTMSYLGAERYGLWMAITSIVGMFMFADLGLGNGLLTSVAKAYGSGNVARASSAVSSTFFILGAGALVVGALLLIVSPFVSWQWLVHTTNPAISNEVPAVLAACAGTFLLNLPLSIVQRTQNGLQQGFQNNLWQCLASILGLVGICLAVHQKLPLAWLVLIATGAAPLTLMANGAVLFLRQVPSLCPRWSHFDRTLVRQLMGSGFGFFLISFLSAAGLYSDNIVVAHVSTLEVVGVFSVPARIALMMVSVAQMIYMPLWPAYGEALARGDVVWVRQTTRRMLILSTSLIGVAGLGFVLVARPLLHWWIGPQINPPFELLVALMLWACVVSVTGPLFMLLNGAGVIWPQVAVYAVFTPLALLLKFAMARWVGISGVVWGTIIAFVLVVLPSISLLVRRTLRSHELEPTTKPQASSIAFTS